MTQHILKNEEKVYPVVLAGELEIDTQGRVWRIKKRGWDRWKRTSVARSCPRTRAENRTPEYLQVRTLLSGKRYHALAHRLVYLHFNGPIPDGMTINHMNGIKTDNRPENLEIATYSEQVRHSLRVLQHGRIDQRGEKNSMAKLTEAAVREILSERENIIAEIKTRHGKRISKLAEKFKVRPQAIWEVIRGKHWTS